MYEQIFILRERYYCITFDFMKQNLLFASVAACCETLRNTRIEIINVAKNLITIGKNEK